MIKIIRGKYSTELKAVGDIISLSDEEEKRLVDRGIAEYCDDSNIQYENTTNVNGQEISYTDDEAFKSDEEIRLMTKAELIAYAKEIEVPGFNDKSTKDVMVDSIMNFIEENSITVEENE